jgi:hypothetical protein
MRRDGLPRGKQRQAIDPTALLSRLHAGMMPFENGPRFGRPLMRFDGNDHMPFVHFLFVAHGFIFGNSQPHQGAGQAA